MNKVFNWKISLISITSFGLITFVVNLNGSLLLTFLAAFKEMIFRFFWGGFVGRLLQRFSDEYKGVKAYVMAAVIPGIFSFIITYALHYFTYTPYPLKTVIVNTILTSLSGMGSIFLFRNNLMKV